MDKALFMARNRDITRGELLELLYRKEALLEAYSSDNILCDIMTAYLDLENQLEGMVVALERWVEGKEITETFSKRTRLDVEKEKYAIGALFTCGISKSKIARKYNISVQYLNKILEDLELHTPTGIVGRPIKNKVEGTAI